jgi:(p)ppGpp synthase/HD superfamily hydrolase
MAFSQDLYGNALHFAAQAHGDQRTPTGLPYVVHVSSVAMEVIAALQAEPGHDDDLAVTSALLHDVVEDTATTIEEVAAAFGPPVAAGVSALTKSAALDKPAAMRDSLTRILEQPPEIAIVKLSDRVTNLAPPPPRWSAAKVAAYRAEAQLILDTLGAASPFLSARLAARIRTYPPGLPGGLPRE